MSDEPNALAALSREDPTEKAELSAGSYAWEYFRYHAGQRQAVFRFYLTLIGAATIAYAYSRRYPPAGETFSESLDYVRILVGLVYIIASFLFWSLDRRSRRLIKLAENTLKIREQRLSSLLKDDSIKLMELGDQKSERFPMSEIESFRQIYSCIFLIIGIIGAILIHQYLGLGAIIIVLLWYIRSLRRRYKKGKVHFSR